MNGDCLTIERPPIRVLLIEDNEGDADLVREGLDGESSVHFHVDWATTLEAGRERLAQGKPTWSCWTCRCPTAMAWIR